MQPYAWQEQLSHHASLAPDGMSIMPASLQKPSGGAGHVTHEGLPLGFAGPMRPGNPEDGFGLKYLDRLDGAALQMPRRSRSPN